MKNLKEVLKERRGKIREQLTTLKLLVAAHEAFLEADEKDGIEKMMMAASTIGFLWARLANIQKSG